LVLVEQKVKAVVLAVVLEVIPLFLLLRQMVVVVAVEMLRQQMAQVVDLVVEPEEIYLALVELEIHHLLAHLKEITVVQLLQVAQLLVRAAAVERLQTLKMEVALKAVMEEAVLLVALLVVL